MRMKWLAAGFVLGGIVGAVAPVIAQAPSILSDRTYYGVGPNGWLVLGCVDAAGTDRPGARMSSSPAVGTYQLQISCN